MLYGLTLLILASLCWSGLDVLRKILVQRIEPITLTAALCAGQSILFFVLYVFNNHPLPSASYWPIGVLCALIALFGALGLNWSLRISPLSQSIPMLSLTPAFAMIHGELLLDESLSAVQIVGLLCSVMGAAGFGLGKGWSKAKGAYIMVGVSFLFSLTMALDKLAIQHAEITTHALFQSTLITLSLGLYLLATRQLGDVHILWDSKKLYVFSVVLFTLAVGLQLEAVSWLSVTLLEAGKRCIGLFASLFLGVYFFSEPIAREKLASAVLLAVGVCIVLLFPTG